MLCNFTISIQLTSGDIGCGRSGTPIKTSETVEEISYLGSGHSWECPRFNSRENDHKLWIPI